MHVLTTLSCPHVLQVVMYVSFFSPSLGLKLQYSFFPLTLPSVRLWCGNRNVVLPLTSLAFLSSGTVLWHNLALPYILLQQGTFDGTWHSSTVKTGTLSLCFPFRLGCWKALGTVLWHWAPVVSLEWHVSQH